MLSQTPSYAEDTKWHSTVGYDTVPEILTGQEITACETSLLDLANQKVFKKMTSTI